MRLISILIASLALTTFSLGGCTEQRQRYAVREDVSLRLRTTEELCGYCKDVEYSPDGQRSVPIRIGALVARNSDIEYMERAGDDSVSVRFVFRREAASRIREITEEHVGSIVAVMSGDDALSLSQISEPFSDGSTIDGLLPKEADYIIKNAAAGPYAGK